MIKIYCAYEDKERSREMLLFLLKKYYGKEVSDSDLVKSPYGKLYLKSGKPFFNISHSKGLIAIAFSDEEIGLDIEKIREINSAKLSEKYFGFTPKTSEEFFNVWTMAESFVKYNAGSILTDLKDITIKDRKIFFKEKDAKLHTETFNYNEFAFAVTTEKEDDIEINEITF